jgi:oligogalacturonide transport system permease protein
MKTAKMYKQSKLKRQDSYFGYLFTSPWIIGFLILGVYPFFYSFYLSLHRARYTGRGLTLEWRGFDNYKEIAFNSDNTEFINSVANFVIESLFVIPLVVIMAFLLGLLINQKLRGRLTFRVIYFFPVIISSGEIFRQIRQEGATNIISFGMLNDIFLGLAPPWILQSIMYAFSQLVTILWYAGVPMLIFLAGLQKRDMSLYEAAKIDGASEWDSFWKITVPILMPMFTLNIVYITIYLGTVEHNQIIRMIDRAIGMQGYGYASAMAWIYAVVLLVLIGLFAGMFRSRYKVK